MDIFKIFEQFPTQKSCIRYLEKVRWGTTPACPHCGSINVYPMPKELRHHCNDCRVSFSVTVNTIFHHTHLPLQKWFLAISLIINAKKGISARQLGRHLHVNRNTAWRISMQIREAMQDDGNELLQGIVEMDETYIGGKPRKDFKDDDHNSHKGKGTKKTPVVGMIERNGKVKAKSFYKKAITIKNLLSLIRESIDTKKSYLVTDHAQYYKSMHRIMPHESVNHTIEYANGWVHTNTIESFWALLKRGIVGQFHKVSVRHLDKYINEFAYRYNNRHNKGLFALTIKRAVR